MKIGELAVLVGDPSTNVVGEPWPRGLKVRDSGLRGDSCA